VQHSEPLAVAVYALERSPDRGLVVALIPAHDEEGQIGEAVRPLHEQVLPPDLIVAVADNCSHGTALEAEAAGAIVFETTGNRHKKAGALNRCHTAPSATSRTPGRSPTRTTGRSSAGGRSSNSFCRRATRSTRRLTGSPCPPG